MREKELKLFIIEFSRGSQIDRSFGKNISKETKKKFREALFNGIMLLMGKADDGSLKNADIFNTIKKIKNLDKDISFGQAQKVVNVVMKQYCFITDKENRILKELDCPLDSTTMKGCKITNNNMKNVSENDYIEYQKRFEKEHDGIRILRDNRYDDLRIDKFTKIED
jgi:F0F1-type ATP synthase gamma subunit